MTYAFARDRGLPFSRIFAKVNMKLDVPINALYLTTALVIIFGCIFLGSSSAFNAIVSASVVALGITYAAPPAINVLRGRKMLPETRPFKLPGPLGWACNLVCTSLSPFPFIFIFKLTPPARHRLRDPHNGTLRLPACSPRHREQHELLHRCVCDLAYHIDGAVVRGWEEKLYGAGDRYEGDAERGGDGYGG